MPWRSIIFVLLLCIWPTLISAQTSNVSLSGLCNVVISGRQGFNSIINDEYAPYAISPGSGRPAYRGLLNMTVIYWWMAPINPLNNMSLGQSGWVICSAAAPTTRCFAINYGDYPRPDQCMDKWYLNRGTVLGEMEVDPMVKARCKGSGFSNWALAILTVFIVGICMVCIAGLIYYFCYKRRKQAVANDLQAPPMGGAYPQQILVVQPGAYPGAYQQITLPQQQTLYSQGPFPKMQKGGIMDGMFGMTSTAVYKSGKAQYFAYSGLEQNEYASRIAKAIPADVRLLSGCADSQISADVSKAGQAFQLPTTAGPGGAGGACTTSLVSVLTRGGNTGMTWVQLLDQMRVTLKQKGYTQVPQLSASRDIALTDPYSFMHPQSNGRVKALLIGINYVGLSGELRGCINDVVMMRTFLTNLGFRDMKVLVDNATISPTLPTYANIVEAFRWLVQGAQAGDTLFFQFSGHGGHVDNDVEKGFVDETILPVDYQTAGQIGEDVLLKELVMPLPEGVRLTAVMDTCHSGTVLELPYTFVANEPIMTNLTAGSLSAQMVTNPNFNLERALKVAAASVGSAVSN